MPTDYRALHNMYAQGMAQPSQVMPNSQPGFNFLQGWSASPHAGFLPPQQARQNPLQYGTPTTGGWQAGQNGQPMGGSGSQYNPQDMLHDGIKGNYAAYMQGQGNDMLHDGIKGNYAAWLQQQGQQAPMNTGIVPPNFQQGMEQSPYMGFRRANPIKPGLIDQPNPGRNPNIGGGI